MAGAEYRRVECSDAGELVRSGVVPRPAVPWQCGVIDVGVRAKGPTLFCSLEGALHVEGGEARWLRRSDVGEDGFAFGWKAAMLR